MNVVLDQLYDQSKIDRQLHLDVRELLGNLGRNGFEWVSVGELSALLQRLDMFESGAETPVRPTPSLRPANVFRLRRE